MDEQELGKQPNSGRMIDYWLGGFNNFEVDRAAARQAEQILPDMANVLIAQRRFLRRAVALVAEQGVKRFLDFGAGLPTAGNTHEIARQYHPNARVVYGDLDPVTVLHAQSLIADDPNLSYLQVDARDADPIFNHPAVKDLLNTSEPVALVAVGLLHFMLPDEGRAFTRQAYDRMPAGSYLIASHGTEDYYQYMPPEVVEKIRVIYARGGSPGYMRSPAEIKSIIEPWQLTEDGMCYTEEWRPDPEDPSIFGDETWRSGVYAFMATKPK